MFHGSIIRSRGYQHFFFSSSLKDRWIWPSLDLATLCKRLFPVDSPVFDEIYWRKLQRDFFFFKFSTSFREIILNRYWNRKGGNSLRFDITKRMGQAGNRICNVWTRGFEMPYSSAWIVRAQVWVNIKAVCVWIGLSLGGAKYYPRTPFKSTRYIYIYICTLVSRKYYLRPRERFIFSLSRPSVTDV